MSFIEGSGRSAASSSSVRNDSFRNRSLCPISTPSCSSIDGRNWRLMARQGSEWRRACTSASTSQSRSKSLLRTSSTRRSMSYESASTFSICSDYCSSWLMDGKLPVASSGKPLYSCCWLAVVLILCRLHVPLLGNLRVRRWFWALPRTKSGFWKHNEPAWLLRSLWKWYMFSCLTNDWKRECLKYNGSTALSKFFTLWIEKEVPSASQLIVFQLDSSARISHSLLGNVAPLLFIIYFNKLYLLAFYFLLFQAQHIPLRSGLVRRLKGYWKLCLSRNYTFLIHVSR